MPDVGEGYLVLADVSGYGTFLAGIELEHASGILEELIREMLDGLTPPLELAGLEGDAVFAQAPAQVLARGETLLELVETTYAAFCRRRDIMQARTTCACAACSTIAALDLKFVVHYGPFAWQNLAGRRSPVGHEVNVIHRLLKNGLARETGWRAYALFSDAALERLGISSAGMHRRVEEYDLGEVSVAAFDLQERLRSQPGDPLDPGEAHWSAELDLPVSPPELWQWLHDPARRSRWVGAPVELAAGDRTGPGAVYHCHHGGSITDHEIVDWRPFSSFTEDARRRRGVHALLHWQLEPANGGTRLRLDMAVHAPLPRAMRRRICRTVAERELRVQLAQLEEAILS